MIAALKAQAEATGLLDRITFRGALGQTDIVTLLREGDLFVLPSKRARSGDQDGLPNVLMEAASQGLAIVATDFAGIPEFVRDGVDGLLVGPGDPAALAAAIQALTCDPGLRARLGASAYAHLAGDFSAQAGLDHLAERLHACLGAEALVP
jgi:glycosyltransferase involved in cell wall biosynthesis